MKTFDVGHRAPRVTRYALALLAFAASCADGKLTTATQVDVDAADLRYPIASITLDPAVVTRNVGDSGVFTPTVKDTRGRTITVALTWASSNPAVVRIHQNGTGAGVSAGTSTITASAGGKTGVSQVTIVDPTPPPPPPPPAAPVVRSVQVTPGTASGAVNDSAQFLAIPLDSTGAEVTGKTITWSSTNTAVVVVSATGMGRATGPGTAQLVATVDGISGRSDITVTGSTPPPPPPPPAPAPVASVSIAPSSVSLTTGSSTQLTATLRDANGNVLTGRSVSWTSTNALIASVDNAGNVFGVVAGSATITATSEGVSGSASATVTIIPPPPPPPSASWPNMPSTYSVITDQPFNPLQVLNWQLIWNNNGYGTITNNATAPFSGSSVFQVMYPAGFSAGSAPATQFFPLGGKKNVYVGTWWKANAGWQGHDSNVNKIHFFYLSNSGGDVYMTAYGPPSGPFELRINLQLVGGDSRDWLRPNVGNGNVTMGDWHRIEWLMEYNTSGANGVVKWWLDGQLIGSYTDVVFPAGAFEEYKLSPTWGGMGGITKQQTDYFWYDHVTIASR